MLRSKKAYTVLQLLIALFVIVVVAGAFGFPALKYAKNMLGIGEEELGADTKESYLKPEDYSAQVEVEEDDWWTHNVYYRFRKGKWYWKCPSCGSEYETYLSLSDPAVDKEMPQQLQEITRGLIGKDLAQGASFLQDRINNDDDAYFIIRYTNKCIFTTTDDKTNPVTNLLDHIRDPNEPIEMAQSATTKAGTLDCPD